jgi:hypothetical protein
MIFICSSKAWELLEDIIKKLNLSLDQQKELLDQTEKSKMYLKCRYRSHCTDESPIASHCLRFALSQAGSKDYGSQCQHEHNQFCEDCVKLAANLDAIEMYINKTLNDETKADLIYEYNRAKDSINEQCRHIIRSVQQTAAKANDIKNLDEETAYMTIDWAQKVLPQEFREGQSSYYGKFGMSVLVGTFTSKDQNEKDITKSIPRINIRMTLPSLLINKQKGLATSGTYCTAEYDTKFKLLQTL